MRLDAGSTLYLDADAIEARLDGAGLLVQPPGRAAQRIPLRRIQRAVIRNVAEPLLEACLALAAAGCSVHFESGQGRIEAVLLPARPAAGKEAQDLAAVIAQSSGVGPFNEWRAVQLRHAISLAFQQNFRGDIAAARRRLLNYLLHYRPAVAAEAEFQVVAEQLRAWLQAELYRRGFHPVIQELSLKGCDLIAVLEQCLGMTLLWAYVRWRRQQAGEVERRRLVELLELQAAAPLLDQLQRHLAALALEYRASMRLREAASWMDELPPTEYGVSSQEDCLVREELPL